MTEKDLQIKISDYIEDNMSDKDKIDFETFLLDNNELKLEVENLKVMLSDIKGIKSLRLDDSFDQRLRRSIDNYDNKKADSLNIFNLFNFSLPLFILDLTVPIGSSIMLLIIS